MALFFLFPLYWIATGSFKPILEITSRTPVWFPQNPTLDNYTKLFNNPAWRWLFNIVFISAVAMLLTCITASLAGYALAKKAFHRPDGAVHHHHLRHGSAQAGHRHPLNQEMTQIFHLNDTLWAVILPTVGWPFGVFLMKQFAETIPNEIWRPPGWTAQASCAPSSPWCCP